MTSRNRRNITIITLAITLFAQVLVHQCNGQPTFTADTLGFHGRLCSPISQDFGEASSRIACAVRCAQRLECLGIFHSSTSKSCLGVGHVVSSMAGCSSTGVNSTFRFYRKSAGGVPGSPCNVDVDCSTPNTGCVNATCRCVGGYKYNSAIYACQTGCAIYGDTYTGEPDHRLLAPTFHTHYGIPLEQCFAYCSAIGYCRSVNYRASVGNCYMKDSAAFEHSPADYIDYPGCDHYVRNCA